MIIVVTEPREGNYHVIFPAYTRSMEHGSQPYEVRKHIVNIYNQVLSKQVKNKKIKLLLLSRQETLFFFFFLE